MKKGAAANKLEAVEDDEVLHVPLNKVSKMSQDPQLLLRCILPL